MSERSFFTFLALAATILMWASAFIAIRIGMREFDAGAFTLLRLGIGALAMLFLYKTFPHTNISKKDKILAMFLGMIGMGIYHTLLNIGEKTVSAGIASFVIGLSPVFVTLFSVFFLKEQVSKLGWIGLFISLCGITLIAMGEIQDATFDFGILYIFGATLASCTYIINAKSLLQRIHSFSLTVYLVYGGAISSMVFLPQLIEDLPRVSTHAILSAIYLAIFSTTLASFTYNFALSKISRSTAASAYYAMPFLTSLMGWILLGEIPKLISFMGGILALMGTILVNAVAYRGAKRA